LQAGNPLFIRYFCGFVQTPGYKKPIRSQGYGSSKSLIDLIGFPEEQNSIMKFLYAC
jgi:hypothetical protein